MIPHRKASNIYRAAKWPLQGSRGRDASPYFVPSFLLCVSPTWANCLSRDILAPLSHPVPTTRRETRGIFAPLSPNPLGSSHRRASRTSLSPPASKTADFTSVRSAEHRRPSRHRTRDARGAPPEIRRAGESFPRSSFTIRETRAGTCLRSANFYSPPLLPPRHFREIFIFVFRLDRLDPSCRDFLAGSSSSLSSITRTLSETLRLGTSREKRMLGRERYLDYPDSRVYLEIRAFGKCPCDPLAGGKLKVSSQERNSLSARSVSLFS